MSETCAVCRKGKGPDVCEICGFSDNGVINREFINTEDANYWLETTVRIYRMQWEASNREAELLAQLEKERGLSVKMENQLKEERTNNKKLQQQISDSTSDCCSLVETKRLKKQFEIMSLQVELENERTRNTELQQQLAKKTKLNRQVHILKLFLFACISGTVAAAATFGLIMLSAIVPRWMAYISISFIGFFIVSPYIVYLFVLRNKYSGWKQWLLEFTWWIVTLGFFLGFFIAIPHGINELFYMANVFQG